MAQSSCKAHGIVGCDKCTDETTQQAGVERMRENARASRTPPPNDSDDRGDRR